MDDAEGQPQQEALEPVVELEPRRPEPVVESQGQPAEDPEPVLESQGQPAEDPEPVVEIQEQPEDDL